MSERETIARIIGEHIADQLKTVAIVDGRVKADLKVLPIADAILASRSSPEWQPISTAPKDGTEIACRWSKSKISGVVYWDIARWLTGDGDEVSGPDLWAPLPPDPMRVEQNPRRSE